MEPIEIAGRYRQLVAGRRRLGDERYGTRHLTRTDLASDRVQEAADTVVYLTLTARAWAAGPVPPDVALEQQLARLTGDALRLGERCCALADPGAPPATAFALALRERFEFGDSRYGDAYLGRENLAEALEEIADCHILVDLERERHLHLTGGPHPGESLLQEIADRCHGLGELTLATRAARTGAAHSPGRSAGPSTRRQALQAERAALARLLDRTRQLLLDAPPRARATATARVARLRPATSEAASAGPENEAARRARAA